MRQRHSPAARLLLAVVAAAAVLSRVAHAGEQAGNCSGGGAAQDGGRRRAGALLGQTTNYLLVYEEGSMADVTEEEVREVVETAGGTLLAWHAAIGTALAASQNTGFSPDAVSKASRTGQPADSRLQSVGPTTGAGVARPARLPPNERLTVSANERRAVQDMVNQRTAATTWGDSLSGLQWNMEQMNVPAAHELTKGRSSVIIGILDTGVDRTHPDLAPNIDLTRSASCVGGVLNRSPAAWDDDDGHGTWCASAAAAAENGRGIVGVAPRAKIAAIKVGDPQGFFYPEATVCAFMHAADSGIHVTSNSYYTDPWLFACKNNPQQNAIVTAVNRAVQYALGKGVDVIVASGNESQDLDDPKFDSSSPNNGSSANIIRDRPVDLNCPQLPLELSGTVGVAATGVNTLKASYSNYGSLFVQVAAPGGDYSQTSSRTPSGGVLGAYPAKFSGPDSTFVQEDGAYYFYLQGTSMAAPHVAGLAALIRSAYPDTAQPTPAQVASAIMGSARALSCPAGPVNGATCKTKTGGVNTFYGHGLADALAAIKAGPQGLLRNPPLTTTPKPTSKPTLKPTSKPTQKLMAKPKPKPTPKPTAKPIPKACGGKCATKPKPTKPKPTKPRPTPKAARKLPAACHGKCATKPKPTKKLPAACGGKCGKPKPTAKG